MFQKKGILRKLLQKKIFAKIIAKKITKFYIFKKKKTNIYL